MIPDIAMRSLQENLRRLRQNISDYETSISTATEDIARNRGWLEKDLRRLVELERFIKDNS